MAFSFRQIRYFVAIAELGSLSSAAKELNVTPSSITVGIHDLEEGLACRLFDRHARGMELTVKGRQFLRHARSILDSVADARRSLEEDAAPVEGTLNLGVTTLVAGYVLAELLARFRHAFPGPAVSIIEDSREDLEHLLVGGELDAAAIILPSGGQSQALQSVVIDASPYRLWMALGHPLAKLNRITAQDLADAPHILLATDEIAETAEIRWRRMGIRPNILLRTRSVEAVRSLVATGAGVAVLPDVAYRRWSLEGDKVEARPLADAVPAAQVGVVWRRGAAMSPALKGFLSVVQAHRPRERSFDAATGEGHG
jgi:DNA-binding transcriptional LysR family regulator